MSNKRHFLHKAFPHPSQRMTASCSRHTSHSIPDTISIMSSLSKISTGCKFLYSLPSRVYPAKGRVTVNQPLKNITFFQDNRLFLEFPRITVAVLYTIFDKHFYRAYYTLPRLLDWGRTPCQHESLQLQLF